MKNIKVFLLGMFLIAVSFLFIKVDAAIMEDPDSFNEDVYIIGSTIFDSDYVITSSRAYEAGINEVKFYMSFGYDLDSIDKTTYYFSGITKKWYVIPNDGGDVQKLTSEQENKFDNDLQIIFTNNVEKTIEFPYVGNVDNESLREGIEYVDGKFKMPVTTTDFSFAKTDGSEFTMSIKRDENNGELLLGEFEINLHIEVRIDGRNYTSVTMSEDGKISEKEFLQQTYFGENRAAKTITDKDGNAIDFATYTFKSGDVINVTTEEAHFQYNGIYYNKSKLTEFLNKSDHNYNVMLLQDTVVDGLIILDENEEKQMYLDLNGYTLSRDNESFLFYVIGKGNKLSISNGKLKSKTGQVITLGQASTEDQNITVFIGGDVVIEAGNIGITPIGKGATLDFHGRIILTEENATAISGNGSDNCGGTEINVYDSSSIKSNKEGTVAFYLPQLGNTHIYGGDFETATIVGIKSGNLNISGGTFKAYGAKTDPKLYNNGIYATGDAIYVELNEAYDDNVSITISNIILNSVNANAILVYNPNGLEMPEIISENYGAVTIDKDKKTAVYSETENAVFEMDGMKFTKEIFIEALNNSSDTNPVKLLKDFVTEDLIKLDEDEVKEMYLDLGGHTLSRKNESFVIYMTGKGNKLNVSNGYIMSKTGTAITVGQASDVDQNITLDISENVFISSGEFGVSVFGKGAKLDFNGTIALNADNAVGISGNGSKGYGGTEINISDKANIVVYGDENTDLPYKNTVAIFLPQAGITNITGGRFNADLIVGIKAGQLNITGGDFDAIGEAKAHTFSNNGINPTGDAIYVEMNGIYDKPVEINVSNVDISAEQGEQIFVYNPDKLQNALSINAEGYNVEILEETE